MKYAQICFIAASMVSVFALSYIRPVSAGRTECPNAASAAGQRKEDKSKRPAAEDKQEDQRIRLGTQLVTVPFNVTDKKNRYINDLSKDDLELFEDNKPQQVFSFERQSGLPITVAMVIDISGSMQYVLPSEPSSDSRDGSFRPIQLCVKSRKELTVRHRRGYFAPKES
jgi:hypothetical protein